MQHFETHWPLFLAIIGAYMLLSFFILGGKKVYFEPYDESQAEPEKAADSH